MEENGQIRALVALPPGKQLPVVDEWISEPLWTLSGEKYLLSLPGIKFWLLCKL
jgi:hypothetical protein